MYRLLIVDDEPVIVNGLVQLFQERADVELDICKAYSATEALDIAKRTKLDILVSDIRMPQKSGLQLVDDIAYYWPSCRIIFLTGYSEFDYVYEAIRKNVDNYILKTEGVAPIFEAVKGAIAKLEEEKLQRLQQEKAQMHFQMAEPLLKKELFEQALQGESLPSLLAYDRYVEVDFRIHPNRPAFFLVGQVDIAEGAKLKLLESAARIVDQHLPISLTREHVIQDGNRLVWLLQPDALLTDHMKESETDQRLQANNIVAYIRGNLERVQNEYEQLFDMSISFGISGNMLERWDQLQPQVEEVSTLIRRRIQLGQKMVIVDYEYSMALLASYDKGTGMKQEEFKQLLIDQIHQYIHDYLDGDLSLTAIAEQVHLNPSYLSRYYKQITGRNLLEYIQETKLAAAIRMMENSHMKLHEIALKVGFDSQPYFTTFFRKMTGTSPQEYRKSL
ncbi:response regulator transcription factor [Paenibacillus terrigena]|uniref:response regulator transcription factor n=1 Tax=Paenibacillus terrigena TaxID=369333 RepID=UPI00037D522B|nr:helix-turn-helix domain-containing protein [Paenibacillus terrigena]